jgi:hypothetical protein
MGCSVADGLADMLQFVKLTFMVGRIIYVLIKKCSSGWRYDETSCYFNVRVMLAIFMSLNLVTFFLFFFPKPIALKLALFGNHYPFYLKFAYPLFFFIALSLLYPRKTIFLKYSVPSNFERSLAIIYGLYCLASIVLLIAVGIFKL